MEHLDEIAQLLLPFVRTAALAADQASPPMGALASRCEELVEARAKALREERGPREEPEAVPATTATPARKDWLCAPDTRALEFLVDALAEKPELIPDAIREAAPGGFYPRFLEYLITTVMEAAQPYYRPVTLLDRAWWWVWSGFAASEYAAQLRDRHERVARELAKTASWRSVDPDRPGSAETPRQSGPDSADDGETPGTFTASMFGGGRFGAGVRTAVGGVIESVRSAVSRAPIHDWHRVVLMLAEPSPVRRQFQVELAQELLLSPDLVRRLAEVSAASVPFSLAFDIELQEIRASRQFRNGGDPVSGSPRAPSRAAAELNLFGVALSGGGIRSATFNLGVLQGLATNRLLRDVDYLSTVSGGGYVGAWLTSWIKRTGHRQSGRGIQVVEDRLRAEPIGNPDSEDVRAVRFLREYSNYLTPRAGFFSADTWTMIAIWLRNTMLNQAVLVLTLAALLMVPWAIWFTLTSLVGHPPAAVPPPLAQGGLGKPAGLLETAPILTIIATLLLVLASVVAGQQLRRFNLRPDRRRTAAGQMLGQGGVLFAIVLPVCAASWLLAVVLCSALPHLTGLPYRQRAVRELTMLFALGFALVAIGGRYWRCFLADRIASKTSRETSIRAGLWATAIIGLAVILPAFIGASIVVGLAAFAAPITVTGKQPPMTVHMVAVALPLLIATMSVMVVLNLGILGRNLYDQHREWWSRVGGWLNIVSLGWLTLFAFSMYSPYLAKIGNEELRNFIVAAGGIGWAAWTAAGVLLGKSGQSPAVGAVLGNSRVKAVILTLAPYVFIAGLLVIVATSSVWLIIGVLPTADAPLLDEAHWTEFGRRWHWIVLGPAGLAAVAFLLSCRVDVNEFSMHHFYKNRLVRCYLGAARDQRNDPARRSPDPFTGFDAVDDLSVADLQLYCGRGDPALRAAKRQRNPRDLKPYVGPIPIINTALNLVKGDDLAWQERKAQSFVFTPFYSGYNFRSRHDLTEDRLAPYGLRPTVLYGYPPIGIGLGTAVAISGAAASPNMGYHSSPAASFLMTMFNARLGWWMGNPRDKYNWLRSSPRRGLLYLLNELFGLTNDHTHFVNLSDGGHFENLGIYELVRRRCRYIIACDAEQDDALNFNGLGNAIRKCRMDLGVEISVRATRIQPSGGAVHSSVHCVVGDIQYPNGETGTLLYLKASVTGDEPADVLEYKARQPAFPHHSTIGDQFFDESQFESYRKLGVHVAQVAFAVPGSEGASLAERFGFLRDYWYPASSAGNRTGHAAQYGALLDHIRAAQGLAFIDSAFFNPIATDRVERQQLFVGASMLDLMQRVFIDLDLETDSEHPHNAGWMAIFGKWMRQEAVQKAWNASRDSFGRRFQRFVDHLPRQ
jgi:hypothetical protein